MSCLIKKIRYPKIYQSSLDFYRMKHKSISIYRYAHVKNIQTNIVRKYKGLTEFSWQTVFLSNMYSSRFKALGTTKRSGTNDDSFKITPIL